jgi:hypothetical protein
VVASWDVARDRRDRRAIADLTRCRATLQLLDGKLITNTTVCP